MKTRLHAFWPLMVATTFALGPTVAAQSASKIPLEPVGFISATPTVVQTGTKPTLSWLILHPCSVVDVASVKPPGTLITKDQIYVMVQMVGSSASSALSSTSTATDARMSLNGSSYFQLFYGAEKDVNPSHFLYGKKLASNTEINFAGRSVIGGSWSPLYTSLSSNSKVMTLVHGQTPPMGSPLHQSPNFAGYLSPYLDSSGKVNIGPMSVLVLMELGTSVPGETGFDLQDQVLLVTFSKKQPNNGHGNNLDGVDSSNPGKGSGGPNGMIDPSGGVDDEAP